MQPVFKKTIERTILRNSIYLSIQPIILNFITIFVIGFIARTLGPSDFGIFNFIIMFTMLFLPLGVMGLDNESIRELATYRNNKKLAQNYAGKILLLRIILSVLTVVVIIIAANIMGYQKRILFSIYAGSAIIFFQLIAQSLNDIFRSYERMEFVALSNLIGGLTLTFLSIIVLYFGYGLFELIYVYAFGQLTIVLISFSILSKTIFKIKYKIDFDLWKKSLKKGMPFFLTAILWFLSDRMDILFLSKITTTEKLGIYTTAIMLVSRLYVIPQSVGASIYPAISKLIFDGNITKVEEITKKYFNLIITIVFPMVIILSFYSDIIITTIFGQKYFESGFILKISIWTLFFRFFGGPAFFILAALKKQRFVVIIYMFTLMCCFLLNSILTVNYGIEGAVITLFLTQLLMTIALLLFTGNSLGQLFDIRILLKCLVLISFLTIFLFTIGQMQFFSNQLVNTIILSLISSFLYFLGTIFLKISKLEDLKLILPNRFNRANLAINKPT